MPARLAVMAFLAAPGFTIALTGPGTRAAPPTPCSGLRIEAGTLESSLRSLGKQKGFEVTFGQPKAAELAVAAQPLEGSNCTAALTRFLEELNLSFAFTEGPGDSIQKLVVVDFKSELPVEAPAPSPADGDALEAAFPEPEFDEFLVAAREAERKKAKEPPDPEELIDMGDGVKMYKVPPPYVPMSYGLIPPNAEIAGPEVLAEAIHGADSTQVNAVVTPSQTSPAPSGPGPEAGVPAGAPATSSPSPPRAKPTPQR